MSNYPRFPAPASRIADNVRALHRAHQDMIEAAAPIRATVRNPQQVPASLPGLMPVFLDSATAFIECLNAVVAGRQHQEGASYVAYLAGFLKQGRDAIASGATQTDRQRYDLYQVFGYLHNGIVDSFEAVCLPEPALL